ncbi:hypothetical protein KAR91_35630 [Candidatus Pacearchaeota archaeon]|nr:hypothetical protein [Candidatus Pacearchaeota archaeon]
MNYIRLKEIDNKKYFKHLGTCYRKLNGEIIDVFAKDKIVVFDEDTLVCELNYFDMMGNISS